ncbi:hypothetical protein [Caballeronia novacaledonica]|uniref:Uncharacterized protein n=1 Tax=Caballeronia novacaledonica TaxID=1544861 RepID=A0AA37IHJ9_9BURK|nr:hypothetical protein [Caballeronia novacaledonica]GJH29389.1 hypothetical protein CBA19CS42_32755 [Caballeronia novacaledonica]
MLLLRFTLEIAFPIECGFGTQNFVGEAIAKEFRHAGSTQAYIYAFIAPAFHALCKAPRAMHKVPKANGV